MFFLIRLLLYVYVCIYIYVYIYIYIYIYSRVQLFLLLLSSLHLTVSCLHTDIVDWVTIKEKVNAECDRGLRERERDVNHWGPSRRHVRPPPLTGTTGMGNQGTLLWFPMGICSPLLLCKTRLCNHMSQKYAFWVIPNTLLSPFLSALNSSSSFKFLILTWVKYSSHPESSLVWSPVCFTPL